MADNTPESELGSIECFQNYTAPEVFIQGLAGIVDQQDVESMIRAQKQMLQRFEKTNEMLTNCNNLCVTRLKTAAAEFKKHTALLIEMRKDLDNIFKRIQALKVKTNSQYPEAFAAVPKLNLESESQTTFKSNNNPKSSSGPVMTTERMNVLKRGRSWSSESGNNSQQDSSPCSSDTEDYTKLPGLYELMCSCGSIYIGQSCSPIKKRFIEHKRLSPNSEFKEHLKICGDNFDNTNLNLRNLIFNWLEIKEIIKCRKKHIEKCLHNYLGQ